MPPARRECSQTNSQLEAGETCFCSSAHTMGIGTGSVYCGSIGVECANTQNFNDNMVVEPNGGGVQLDVSAFWDSTSRNGLRKEIGWECLEAMIALEHTGLATPRSTFFFDVACARFVCAPPLSSFLAPPLSFRPLPVVRSHKRKGKLRYARRSVRQLRAGVEGLGGVVRLPHLPHLVQVPSHLHHADVRLWVVRHPKGGGVGRTDAGAGSPWCPFPCPIKGESEWTPSPEPQQRPTPFLLLPPPPSPSAASSPPCPPS